MLADVLTKDDSGPSDTWRGYLSTGKFGLLSELEALEIRAEAKRLRQEKGVQRQLQSESDGQEAMRRRVEKEAAESE